MKSLLTPIKNEDFKNKVEIKCNNILDGLDLYCNGLLEYVGNEESFNIKEKCFLEFLEEVFYINNNSVFIDFYLKNLNGEELLNLLNLLEYDDKIILLENLKNLENDTIYFKIDSKELIYFISKLNTKSLFFCTLYFLEKPCTIWGNYNLSFPCFFNNKEDLIFYKKLAEKYKLSLKAINIK